jgi:hypothetical protein
VWPTTHSVKWGQRGKGNCPHRAAREGYLSCGTQKRAEKKAGKGSRNNSTTMQRPYILVRLSRRSENTGGMRIVRIRYNSFIPKYLSL